MADNKRQLARRTVSAAVSAIQAKRAERDKRIAAQALLLATALAERDESIRRSEQAAAAAIRTLLADGVGLSEIPDWCGDLVDPRELGRLAKLTVGE